MHRRYASCALADSQFGACRQKEFRIDEDVAFLKLTIRIRKKLDGPRAARILHRRVLTAENTAGVVPKPRAAVPGRNFLGESSDRLLSQNGDNTFQPRILPRMQVNEVAARRQGRIL